MLKGFPAQAMCCRAAQSPAGLPTPESVHQSVLRVAPGLATPGHARGTERRGDRTHALPPAASPLLRSRDPAQLRPGLQPRPTCLALPLTVPRRAPPSSQHVMTQDVVAPYSSCCQSFWGWAGVCTSTCFPT